MIINKEEVEKAAYNNTESLMFSHNSMETITMANRLDKAFKDGVKFAEKYVQQHVQDIIIENQGLKLYKDNEAERFKKLAIELIKWLNLNPQFTDFADFRMNEKELYNKFIKENYIK